MTKLPRLCSFLTFAGKVPSAAKQRIPSPLPIEPRSSQSLQESLLTEADPVSLLQVLRENLNFGFIMQLSPLFCQGPLTSGLSLLTSPLPALGSHDLEGKPDSSFQGLTFSCVPSSSQTCVIPIHSSRATVSPTVPCLQWYSVLLLCPALLILNSSLRNHHRHLLTGRSYLITHHTITVIVHTAPEKEI